MKVTSGGAALAVLLVLSNAPHIAHAQAPPVPAAPVTTIWDKLGVPQAFKGLKKVKDHLTNAHGNHPGMEAKPPLTALTDAANLASDNPAIKKAAEIKKEEDKAPQKIKAIKYLAKIGCGCYDRDGSITDAILAATDDCTESVRLAAVKAIAKGKQCGRCDEKKCCGEDLIKRLAKMAYEKDDTGCWIEPSQRVRKAAIEALLYCCPDRGPGEVIEEPEVPREVPVEEDEPEIPEGELPATPPADTTASDSAAQSQQSSRRTASRRAAIRESTNDSADVAAMLRRSIVRKETGQEEFGQRPAPASLAKQRGELSLEPGPPLPTPAGSLVGKSGGGTSSRSYSPPVQRRKQTSIPSAVPAAPRKVFQLATTPKARPVPRPSLPRGGTIQYVNVSGRTAFVRLDTEGELPVGSRVRVYHKFITGRGEVGRLEVVASKPGTATARAVGRTKLTKIANGDDVLVFSYGP